ncbi:MAG: MFS transporter [Oscillospiraceae bacterium]|nr:MFS transporter [Oscillospiraceae bacterium]
MKRSAGPISPHARKLVWMLTAVYFASYFTRINFAVMLVKICADLGAPKTAVAIVLTGLTVTYGAGQILSGIIGDKLPAPVLLSIGLALATLCNITLPLTSSISLMTAIWCVNGFAHSLLWPPIVRIMSTCLTDEEYSYGAVRVSWGSSFATVALYLLCPLLLNVLNWKSIFFLCAAVSASICLLWTLLSARLLPPTPSLDSAQGSPDAPPSSTGIPLPSTVHLPLILIMASILLQGTLRDGVTNWMPSYLSEAFSLSAESAIVTAVIPAIFSILSFSFFGYLHRKLLTNEVFCSAIIYAAAVPVTLLLYWSNHPSFPTLFSALLLAILIAFMHGINLMLITVVPKRLIKSGKVSTYSGLLNAFTYVGASISGYGFAYLAQTFGWSATILTWAIISLIGALLCLIAAPMWKVFRQKYADTP